jgi:hypothetical protein
VLGPYGHIDMEKNIDRLNTLMTQEHTDPSIIRFIISGLEAFWKLPTNVTVDAHMHQSQQDL